ncbi:hypothetical protein BpHYR1_031478 [Brachionus plicatilis]|uniref:Uncharacterized protein n=1 Tax=Brachionus plicatilis TaxID=10195 RepID=A0A3M7PIV3_BRAPC|nr:hypothetical protein BpHYR1_031478 [Brachionus plicatilis]
MVSCQAGVWVKERMVLGLQLKYLSISSHASVLALIQIAYHLNWCEHEHAQDVPQIAYEK